VIWHSFHFFPLEAPDVFLARGLRPFLEHHVWPVKGARAFFLRYEDEKGLHLRLRFKGEREWLDGTLQPAFKEWFEERGHWESVPYMPEADRFGGEEALALAEEHFHISSRVALDRLNRPYSYGDAMFDAIRLNVALIIAANFDRERAAWYFGQLSDQWLHLFFKPEDQSDNEAFYDEIKAQFELGLKRQEDSLRHVVPQFWNAVTRDKIDKKQPEWTRWIRGNELILKDLGSNLEKALPSLIHLTHNRIGLNNQDEVFICYILSRTI
jgi:thiopeptide-type bacteriocin biosynthesis protein